MITNRLTNVGLILTFALAVKLAGPITLDVNQTLSKKETNLSEAKPLVGVSAVRLRVRCSVVEELHIINFGLDLGAKLNSIVR